MATTMIDVTLDETWQNIYTLTEITPATANIVPTFAANTIEPHFWYRIGV